VIHQEQLRERRVSDLAQALIDAFGVDVGQNVGKTGGLTISVRGMPSDYTLMLIDGRHQVFAEVARPGRTNEIRLFRLKA
jgi:outer membrane receptor for ferrienterochelin and colicins